MSRQGVWFLLSIIFFGQGFPGCPVLCYNLYYTLHYQLSLGIHLIIILYNTIFIIVLLYMFLFAFRSYDTHCFSAVCVGVCNNSTISYFTIPGPTTVINWSDWTQSVILQILGQGFKSSFSEGFTRLWRLTSRPSKRYSFHQLLPKMGAIILAHIQRF